MCKRSDGGFTLSGGDNVVVRDSRKCRYMFSQRYGAVIAECGEVITGFPLWAHQLPLSLVSDRSARMHTHLRQKVKGTR
ncbi:MAG: hypothetical protein K2G90_02715 [Muribaculaceae bacterium]|nr:hypothetical protein [Muribaculaceae bacterium]